MKLHSSLLSFTSVLVLTNALSAMAADPSGVGQISTTNKKCYTGFSRSFCVGDRVAAALSFGAYSETDRSFFLSGDKPDDTVVLSGENQFHVRSDLTILDIIRDQVDRRDYVVVKSDGNPDRTTVLISSLATQPDLKELNLDSASYENAYGSQDVILGYVPKYSFKSEDQTPQDKTFSFEEVGTIEKQTYEDNKTSRAQDETFKSWAEIKKGDSYLVYFGESASSSLVKKEDLVMRINKIKETQISLENQNLEQDLYYYWHSESGVYQPRKDYARNFAKLTTRQAAEKLIRNKLQVACHDNFAGLASWWVVSKNNATLPRLNESSIKIDIKRLERDIKKEGRTAIADLYKIQYSASATCEYVPKSFEYIPGLFE